MMDGRMEGERGCSRLDGADEAGSPHSVFRSGGEKPGILRPTRLIFKEILT